MTSLRYTPREHMSEQEAPKKAVEVQTPAAETKASEDVLFLHSRTEDGEGARVVRARNGRLEAGEVRPLAEGKPIHGEVVSLTPRADQPWLCDVKVTMDARAAASREKPAQVASSAYRESWDRIFGEKAREEALN
jgi:hypothetical protein